MAKSKHDSPSPKKKRSKDTSKHQSNQQFRSQFENHASTSSSKRKAESRPPSADHGIKRLATGKGPSQSGNVLDEATFKRQFAADFCKVKEEELENAVTAPISTPARLNSVPNAPDRESSLPINPVTPGVRGDSQAASLTQHRFGPEEVLISIIFRQPFAEQLARAGIEHFIQEGRRDYHAGNELGISRVNDFIALLDSKGIPDDLRARVVGMLQQDLRESCNNLHARIGDLGLRSSSEPVPADAHRAMAADGDRSGTMTVSRLEGVEIPTAPSESNRATATSTQRETLQGSHTAESDSSSYVPDDGRDETVDNWQEKARELATGVETRNIVKALPRQSRPPETAGATSHNNNGCGTGTEKSSGSKSESRMSRMRSVDVLRHDKTITGEEASDASVEDDNSDYVDGGENVLSSWRKPSVPTTPVKKRRSAKHRSLRNVEQYGTAMVKKAFDIFARCAISACSIAPREDDDPVEIRAHALKAWRKVGYTQKGEWEKLFADRHKADADISNKGHKLLESDQLLPLVIPHFHSRAWVTGSSHQDSQGAAASSQLTPAESMASTSQDRHHTPHDTTLTVSASSASRPEPSSSAAPASSFSKLAWQPTHEQTTY